MLNYLSEEQVSEWEGLKGRFSAGRRLWMRNITLNVQRLNTMEREDSLVSLVRRLQEFGEVVEERREESRRQHAEARAQAEVIIK